MSTASQFFGSGGGSGGGTLTSRLIHATGKSPALVVNHQPPFKRVPGWFGGIPAGNIDAQQYVYAPAATYFAGLYLIPYATGAYYTHTSESSVGTYRSGPLNCNKYSYVQAGGFLYMFVNSPNAGSTAVHYVYRTSDGINWTQRNTSAGYNLQALSFHNLNENLVTLSTYSQQGYAYSTDGAGVYNAVSTPSYHPSSAYYNSTDGYYYFVGAVTVANPISLSIRRTTAIGTAPTEVFSAVLPGLSQFPFTFTKVGNRLLVTSGGSSGSYADNMHFFYSDDGTNWFRGANIKEQFTPNIDKDFAPTTTDIMQGHPHAQNNQITYNGISYYLFYRNIATTYNGGQLFYSFKTYVLSTPDGINCSVHEVGNSSVGVATYFFPAPSLCEMNGSIYVVGAPYHTYKIDPTAKEIVIEY